MLTCSGNNRKLVLVVWPIDLARSPTRSAVGAAKQLTEAI